MLSGTNVRLVGTDEPDLVVDLDAAISCAPLLLSLPLTEEMGGALQTDATEGEKDGWLVWVSTSQPLVSADTLHFTPIRHTATFGADCEGQVITPPRWKALCAVAST